MSHPPTDHARLQPLRRTDGCRKGAADDVVRCQRLADGDRQPVQAGEGRGEQEGLIAAMAAVPLPGSAELVADRAHGLEPGILVHRRVGVVKQRHAAIGSHDQVQHLQRRGAVHPVETAAHDHQLERPHGRRQVVGAAPHHLHRHAGRLRRLFAGRQHVWLRVHGSDGHAQAGKGNRQHAGAAAQIQHGIARRQPRQRGHALNQPVGISEPVALIIGHGALEAARIMGNSHRTGTFWTLLCSSWAYTSPATF
jgi:hypothetical protein